MSSREIKLDGGEITLLKALGLSGTPVHGKQLAERMEELEPAEFLDTLDGMITIGYVLSSKVNVRTMDDVDHATFRVNPSYSRDLKEALNPGKARDDRNQQRRHRRS